MPSISMSLISVEVCEYITFWNLVLPNRRRSFFSARNTTPPNLMLSARTSFFARTDGLLALMRKVPMPSSLTACPSFNFWRKISAISSITASASALRMVHRLEISVAMSLLSHVLSTTVLAWYLTFCCFSFGCGVRKKSYFTGMYYRFQSDKY